MVAAILLIFLHDAAALVSIWWTSSTFGHCLLIPPILGWLVWLRRQAMVTITPRSWTAALAILAAGAFGWLLGEAAGVALARHLGLVMMLQGAVMTLLGPAVSRVLMFPLGYMIFMIPFGEPLVPPLQTLTAQMCMAMLGWIGIPARIDGVFITTSAGYFEVAEACSGVNFLIAMLAFAVLVANVCFKSWTRRISFVLFAVATSILANGVRAWGTIAISHATSLDFAAGFDHIVYGWIFFGLVLAIVMAAAWPFFDRAADDPFLHRFPSVETPPPPSWPYAVALAALAIVAAPMLWANVVTAAGRTDLPYPVELPELAGWQRAPISTRHPWMPRFDGADHRLFGRYRNAAGDAVDLGIFVYGWQAEGRELVGYGQGAIDPASDWAWTSPAPSIAGGQGARITAPGPVVREVMTFYRAGDVLTGSPARVKLATLKVRLTGGDQRAVAIMVSAEEMPGHDAHAAIGRFIAALGPLDKLADGIAARATAR
ncbi:exosortase A [Sphingobium boeckii]|uniref:Exosortase A n=1 Tax=Sphingobium boeckii TaxID=1082345 RepID=A0A7W9AKM3_9SPHN|nr:exosortase A [Sphingobium boeckii]